MKTSSGNICATYNNFDKQDIHIAATSGNIQLKLPSTAEFLLEAKTSTGKLHSDFPVTNENKKMEGQIGNKSNNVVLQTSTGNINLLSDFYRNICHKYYIVKKFEPNYISLRNYIEHCNTIHIFIVIKYENINILPNHS